MQTFPLPPEQDSAKYNNYYAGTPTQYEPTGRGGYGELGAVTQEVKSSNPDNVGLRYSMGQTVQATMDSDTMGTVHVQTRKPNGEVGRYYFDGEALVSRGMDDRKTGRWLGQDELLNPDNDITVGGAWALAPGETVDAIVFSRGSGGNLGNEVPKGKPGMTAPTLRGREELEKFKTHYAATKPR